MTRLAVLVACAAGLAAVAPVAASAAPGWSTAQQHGVAGPEEGRALISAAGDMGARGDVVVAAQFWDRSAGAWRGQVVHRVRRGRWEGPVAPGRGADLGQFPSVGVSPDGFAAVTVVVDGRDGLALRSPRGDWSLVEAPSGVGNGAVAVAEDGVVSTAWPEIDCSSSPCTARVLAATRGTDGAWSPAAVVASAPSSESTFSGVDLDADAAGGLVLAYAESRSVSPFVEDHLAWAATRPPVGSWSAPVEVFPRTEPSLHPDVEVNERGDAAVATTERDRSGDGTVRLARRPAGGRFGPSEVVVAADEGPIFGSLAVGDTGTASVVFQHWPDRTRDPGGRVSVASARVGGPLTTEVLARPASQIDREVRLAALEDDGLVLLGHRLRRSEPSELFFSAFRPAGGGSIAEIPPPADVGTPGSALLLMSDRDDEAVAFWERGRSGTPPRPISSHTAVFGPLPRAPRLRLDRELVVGRRGILRLRLLFHQPVSGLLRISDVFERTLAKRSLVARAEVPVRMRMRLPRWLVRKLRRGAIRVQVSLRLTTPTGRRFVVKAPTTLRRR